MPYAFSRILMVTGHYGSGKTNLAVNLAVSMKAQGKQVVLVDLDIVNPYFRSADFAGVMQQHGIEMITPLYARSNLDIPALTGQLDAAITSDKQLIIDVGGDDAGAAALGRYSPGIMEQGSYDMICVVNAFRYLTRTPEEASGILGEIEKKARLGVTGIVNNSNLGEITTAQDVAGSLGYAAAVASGCGVPLCFTAAMKPIAHEVKALLNEPVYPVDVYVKKPWETSTI